MSAFGNAGARSATGGKRQDWAGREDPDRTDVADAANGVSVSNSTNRLRENFDGLLCSQFDEVGPMKREASCSCGALKVVCKGEPELVSLCHCEECQKRTGAPFGIAAFFRREKVEILREPKAFWRSSDSGFSITFHFCEVCGSNVFWEPARKPEFIAVAVGAFGDKHFPKPSQEVYIEGRHDWIEPL